MYLVKASPLLKKIYPKALTWDISSTDTVYLTFDDGPHPDATDFVLQQLDQFQAKATFFCIGKNVIAQPDLYRRILDEGHSVGNHSHNHLNGWKYSVDEYLADIQTAEQVIESNLYRPPYGKIRKKQAEKIQKKGFSIVMWDVLCGDFDTKISGEQCWANIQQNITPGSIVVFHDSSKALVRLRYALPKTLSYCQEKGWKMCAINKESITQH